MHYEHLIATDPELYASMERELQRQRDHIELIASENFTSRAVIEAMGSYLTNKYAERDSTEPRPRGCSVLGEPPQGLPSF